MPYFADTQKMATDDSPLQDDEGLVAQGLQLQRAQSGQHPHQHLPQLGSVLLC